MLTVVPLYRVGKTDVLPEASEVEGQVTVVHVPLVVLSDWIQVQVATLPDARLAMVNCISPSLAVNFDTVHSRLLKDDSVQSREGGGLIPPDQGDGTLG